MLDPLKPEPAHHFSGPAHVSQILPIVMAEVEARFAEIEAESTRQQCRRKLVAAIGQGGFQAFISGRQPFLGDRTGAEIIQHSPGLLLRRLMMLPKPLEGDEE